jgi:hypothetical protein
MSGDGVGFGVGFGFPMIGATVGSVGLGSTHTGFGVGLGDGGGEVHSLHLTHRSKRHFVFHDSLINQILQ